MKVYTPENLRSADKYTIEKLGVPGTVLMDKAADALFEALSEHFGKNRKFVILCGKGNNGGDGWALGMKLSKVFERAICISVFGEPSTSDALYFYGKCRECMGLGLPLKIIQAKEDIVNALRETGSADIIVDALFGTGFSGDIEKESLVGELIAASNTRDCFKLSADIPSGADALTGRCASVVFRADVTVTFAKGKIGMFSYPARAFCEKVIIADIGIPEDVFEAFGAKYEVTDDNTVRRYLPKRYADSNKGSYGKLLVYAGSRDMTGAAYLALSGALRSGVGLTVFAGDPYVTDVLKHRLSEPVFMQVRGSDEDTDMLIEYSKKCSAILIGCGLGTSEEAKSRVIRLIKECDCPIILDADGINAVSDNINVITEAKKGILLTPHPLEFSRISGLSVTQICENRIECASDFAKKYGCNVLLKGAGTVICGSDGRVCINPIDCSALAKGGSGDVLAGIIASFVSQGAGLYESAVTGAYLHGRAGEELAREYSEYGVMPSDIPERAARILARTV